MCEEIDDDVIEELAMGRSRGTKDETHVLECGDCKERLRQSREWITMFRQAFDIVQGSEEQEVQKKAMQKSKSLAQQPSLLPVKRTG